MAKAPRFPYHELSNYRIALNRFAEVSNKTHGEITIAFKSANQKLIKNSCLLAKALDVWERDVEVKP